MAQFWRIDRASQIADRLKFFGEFLQKWDFSKPAKITVEPYTDPRSLTQNALFHVWMKELAAYFTEKGHPITPELIKTLMKHEHLGYVDLEIGSKVIKNQLKATSRLDKGEMNDFMYRVQAWAADKGCLLPIPENSEYYKLRIKQEK